MRKRSLLQTFLAIVFLVALAVGHAACGGGNSSPTSPSPTMSGTPTPGPPPPTPRY